MSAVKRHLTETVILAALEKSGIDPKSYPLILEWFAGGITQAQLSEKYGLKRNSVSELLTRAKKRIKQNAPAGIWMEFEGARLPVSMIRKLGALAKLLDDSKDETAKRIALDFLDEAIAKATQALEPAPQGSAQKSLID